MTDFISYIDTDSVVGGSIIEVNGQKMTIEDYFQSKCNEYIYYDGFNNNYVKKVEGDVTSSVNGEGQIEKDVINYVMGHKVKKRMYRITSNGKSVTVTEDHSVMVLSGGELKGVTPKFLGDNCFVIQIHDKNNLGFDDNFTVEDLGVVEEWVYDIETEKNHNFFANDILVHNSCYVSIFRWLEQMGVDLGKWDSLTQDKKIEYVQRIAKEVEKYVNEKSFDVTQKQHYNSQVDDFKINFEQEKIALSAIFATKKRYATWTLLDEGSWKDDMSITGLEIIRSDSPELVKPKIKNVLEMLLKNKSEGEVSSYISECKKELKKCSPNEIAENKGVNKLEKYINPDNTTKKGAPHQIKGVANLRYLLDKLDLDYEVPQNGNKAKVVYLQKNKYNVNSLSFLEWPKEFEEHGIFVDYPKMIENNFTKKLKNLLVVLKKEDLLNDDIGIDSLFF